MRGHGLKLFGGQVRIENELFAFEVGFDFFQRVSFAGLRIAAKSSFNELEVFKNQIGAGLARGQDRVRVEYLIFTDDIHLGIGFLVRFNQFVGLIEARVFQIVLAKVDFGDAE